MNDNTQSAAKAATVTWVLTDRETRSGKTLFKCTGCGKHDPAPAESHECSVKRLKLDPCLADGVHWTIDDSASTTLMESIQLWMDEGAVGEAITIEIVAMTDREVEGLPDI